MGAYYRFKKQVRSVDITYPGLLFFDQPVKHLSADNDCYLQFSSKR